MFGNRGNNSQQFMRNFIGESEHQRMLEGEDAGVAVPGWVVGVTLLAAIGLWMFILFRFGNLLLGAAAGGALAVLVWLGVCLIQRLKRKRPRR